MQSQIDMQKALANMRPKAVKKSQAKSCAPFDPLVRSAEVERIVMRGSSRRYYRFRHARFYGGIISADAIGCNLLCNWRVGRCWNYSRNQNPDTADEFLEPAEVAARLIGLAEKNSCWNFRISGCENFLGQASADHLLEVLRLLRVKRPACGIVIESNAVWIGANPEILDRIPKGNTSLRISLKGHDEAHSQEITGATGAHALQMAAIRAASERNMKCRVAVMAGHFDLSKVSLPRNIGIERERLSGRGV
jgi:uncharacterized Fe-S cluster-containing radical SAM superfamily protein